MAAMAACAPGGFQFAVASEVAQLGEDDAIDALQRIFSRSLVVEVDRSSRRYRLHPLIRQAAPPSAAVRQRHAEIVLRRLWQWEQMPLESAPLIDEAEHSLMSLPAELVSAQIATLAGNLSRALGRLSQAWEFYERLSKQALDASQRDWLENSYGGQALILKDWGRLDEAMALHKKEEAIGLELGDRAGLQRSYGNQALILQDWGRLDEAMALYNKEEVICMELGDRAGLAYSFWSQGLLLRSQGNPGDAKQKLEAAHAIFTEVGLVRQRDAVRRAIAKA